MPSASVDGLTYQTTRTRAPAAGSNEVATIKLRYKPATGKTSRLLSRPIHDGDRALEQSSESFRFSASVAAFGMLLRDSQYKGNANFELVEGLATRALGNDPHGDRREFVRLVRRAARLGGGRATSPARYNGKPPN